MKKVADYICKKKTGILIISIILIILSVIGMKLTNINYDILVYLPEDIETVEGQNILTNDFGMGAYTIIMVENMNSNQLLKLEDNYRNITGVNQVVSIYDVLGTTVPIDMLPNEITSKLYKENTTLLFITFDESTSSKSTIDAIREIKEISSDNIKISGMSAMVLDTMDLSEKEITIYIIIAVILCLVVLELSLDSYLVPILLLLNIGIAILFNLGSNIIFGEISYITKALVAVLQLGVTTDFSIFLYHAYENRKKQCIEKEKAMSDAIVDTFTSVFGSALTTIAGFLVLCTMNLTLGKDLGLVMAKGVLLGVICVLTLFPSLLLICDKAIEKMKHRSINIHFENMNKFIVKHYKLIFILFIVLFIPTYLANSKVDIYYKIDESLPKTLDSIVANNELKEKFNLVSPEIILINKDIKNDQQKEMIDRIEQIEGIDFVLSFAKIKDLGLNETMLPSELVDIFESEDYQMMLLNSTYEIASDELNNQILEVNTIIKEYDNKAILAGEGPLMKDLVTISNEDFNNVNYSSIICILIIMFIVLKSFSLPILLILAIEFAIFTNMSISYFGVVVLPFVAPIVLGTIQLGATIDYAILMTTNYLKLRKNKIEKKEAILKSMDYCSNSIFISGMCFFAATFGVGIYSDLEMVGSLCTLISRGAIISMIVVLIVLPSILLIFDSIIMKTTYKMRGENKMKTKRINKIIASTLIIAITLFPISSFALTKDETVYVKLDSDGKTQTVLVNEHLINNDNLDIIDDYTDLENILNINSDHSFTLKENLLTWNSKGSDIFYQGTTTKELPVSETITYQLDGEDIELKDLIGKSGKVSIKINYQNHDEHLVKVNGINENLYTPFVVMTTTIIPIENNSNISIVNGKIVNNGKNYIVLGISTPGLYESTDIKEFKSLDTIEITYDTEKFELSSIYSIVTPKIIENEDLNIFNKLDSLSRNTKELQESINKIEEGSTSLLSGINKISDGNSQIVTNLNTVLKTIEELNKGIVDIDSGLNQILEQLTTVKNSLTGQNNIEKINQIKSLINKNDTVITSLQKENNQLKLAYDNNNLLNIGYEELLNTNLELYQIKYTYEHSYEMNSNLLALLTMNNQALQTSLETLNTTSTTISTLIDTLNQSLTKLENGTKQVSDGIGKLYSGVELLNAKTQKLASSTNTLKDGMTTLNNGIIDFNKEGISKLTQMGHRLSKISNKTEALIKLANNYQSFSYNKDIKANTKFILALDGVKAPKEEKKIVKETKKETIIDRIKNLFK